MNITDKIDDIRVRFNVPDGNVLLFQIDEVNKKRNWYIIPVDVFELPLSMENIIQMKYVGSEDII